MRIHNWPMKALIIVAAAAALWLGLACSTANTITEVPTTDEAIASPTAQPTVAPTVTATPTLISDPIPSPTPTLEDALILNQLECTTETPELTSRLNTTEAEQADLLERIRDARWVKITLSPLLWNYPHVYDVTPGFLRDENGEWTEEWGIIVWVRELREPNGFGEGVTRYSKVPIPNLLPDTGGVLGVEIQLVEMEPPTETAPSGCNIRLCGVELGEDGEITTRNTFDQRWRVWGKYQPLFWRHPYFANVDVGRIYEVEEGTDTEGIIVRVYKQPDQTRVLPPEDRIPDCLEGIPIEIRGHYIQER